MRCNPWGRKEFGATEQLNWGALEMFVMILDSPAMENVYSE